MREAETRASRTPEGQCAGKQPPEGRWCPSLAPTTSRVMGHIAFTWLPMNLVLPLQAAFAECGDGHTGGWWLQVGRPCCAAGSSLPTCPLSLTPSVRKLLTSFSGIFNMQAGQREVSLRGSYPVRGWIPSRLMKACSAGLRRAAFHLL